MEEDLILGQNRRVNFIKQWRHKFQTHFYEVRNKQDAIFTKALQDVLPFLIAKAIIIALDD